MEKLTQKERKAYEYIYEYFGMSIHLIDDDYNNDYINTHTARNGQAVAWYLDDSREMAVYVDTLEELTQQEIEEELL